MKFLFLLSISWGIAAPVWSQTMAFKDHGRVVRELSLSEMKKLSPEQSLKVWDPNEGAPIAFRVIALEPILQAVFGAAWTKSEEFLFTCSDGYQPSLPRERFAQAHAYLAFAREGHTHFGLANNTEGGKKTDLQPFYLVWDNMKNDQLHEGDGVNWPYKVVSLDLIQFVDRFPRLAPPEKSAAVVSRGFVAFRRNCLQCHALNGEGGHAGPELNFPVNVTEYYREDRLHQWISDPASIRWKTPMPPINKNLRERSVVIDEIVAYLKAMAAKKIKPGS